MPTLCKALQAGRDGETADQHEQVDGAGSITDATNEQRDEEREQHADDDDEAVLELAPSTASSAYLMLQ